jgi:hypothetical protein
MTTAFALLCARCGLSRREAARVLGVREDTVYSWSTGRNPAPPGVVAELRALYRRIEAAAAEALAQIGAEQQPEELTLALAADDAEAQALGWPSAGAHAAVLGLVIAGTDRPCRIVAGAPADQLAGMGG